MAIRVFISVIFGCLLFSCAPRTLGYQETFQPILQFMDYKPGMVFADVGAGDGALTIQMATLMTNSAVYIQDIDSAALNKTNIDKFLRYYSRQTKRDLRSINTFHTTIGDVQHTNLPAATFDLIYSNATIHNFTAMDSMLTDLGRKLKPGGMIFFRDSFKGDHNEGAYCSDPKCARPLLTIDEFMVVMKRNGYEKVKSSPDMSGYPVFGFTKN